MSSRPPAEVQDHRYSTAPRRGYQLEIRTLTGDDIGTRIERRGLPYEWEELAISNAIAMRSRLVVDIGANVGNHSLYWARHSGVNVVSFEPKGEALELLDLNIGRNHLFSRITMHPVALGAEAGRGRLHVTAGNLGASHVEVAIGSAPSTEHDVEIKCLDSFYLHGIGLLKIDVEGMELEVLRGSKATLRREQPVVWVELLSIEADQLVRMTLAELGYWRRPLWMSETNALFVRNWAQVAALVRSPLALRLLAKRAIGHSVRSLRRRVRRALISPLGDVSN